MDVDCEKIAQEDNYWTIFTHLLSQTYIYIYFGEGNGTLLQYSCLEGKSHGQRSLVGCSPWGC